MNQYFRNETVDLVVQTGLLTAILVLVFFIYRYIFAWFSRRVARTHGVIDDQILRLFRKPLLLFIFWFSVNILIHLFYSRFSFFPIVMKINNLILILALAWLSAQFITAIAFFLQTRYDLSVTDNIRARKSLTQVKVFKAIAVTIIVIIAIGAALMTFDQARKAGISILTSAGIMGIIVGFAAQKSLGMILAGIQLAITQPIRLDDIVIVEGEFGRIEEIELTYVVVQVWDERRLILPVTWFLEKPFQNLTRSSTSASGTIFLYVDYNFNVDILREVLPGMLNGNSNWDGRTANIEVTRTTEQFKEIRIVLSSADSSRNWNLRTGMREKLIDYINSNYPDSFARIRIRTV